GRRALPEPERARGARRRSRLRGDGAAPARGARGGPPLWVRRVILREAFDYEFSRLDPTGDHIDPPSVALYETVLAKGPDWGAHLVLAESWQVSADGLEWRVRLRPGLRFHSGAPCDAEAIVAPLEHLRFGSLPGQQLWYWDPVD